MKMISSTSHLKALLVAILALAPVTLNGQENDSLQQETVSGDSLTSITGPKTEAEEKEKKAPTRIHRTLEPVEGYQHVEMFAAINKGDIDVQLIPRDATESKIFITNNSDEPLAIELPEAFAGIPVLAQAGGGRGPGGGGGGFGGGGGGVGGGGQGGGGVGGGGQGFGGGAGGGQGGGGFGGGGGGQGGGGGFGGGVFNIPAGKKGAIKVTTVCLEFNKRDPKPSIKYEIRPIAELSKDPVVAQICKMLANDEISQQVAQAAAWNRTDNKSWDELVNHDRIRLSNGYFEKFFTPDQVSIAQQVVAVGIARAQLEAQQEQSPESQSWRTDMKR